MSRVKRGKETHRKHKKLLKSAKGYWGQRKNVVSRAKETVLRAQAFAFKSRKIKKRDMRSLFITRITAAATENGMSYSQFMHGLKTAHIELNRKMLSQLAIFEPQAFAQLVKLAQK
jgi:large subunit ribosomal protein L20